MPIGFQTFVDGTEIIQIDSERFTYVLKTTGTVTGSPQYGFYGGSYNIAYVTISSCVRPIVFCPPGQVISSEFFSSGTLEFSILSTITSTLEYAVFDIGNYPTTPNIGLKLYNSLGQITFDSNLNPLLVFSSGYEEPQNTNTTSIPTLDITRSYWYTGGGSYTTVYSSSEGFGELISEDYLNIFFINGTIGGFSQEFLSSGGHNQTPSVEYGPGSNFIIADMTHIVGASSTVTYSVSASSPVNEGSSSTVTVTTTNVTNGTTLYWTVLNGTTANADFSATSGSFTVNSNSGSFTVPIVADATTEGSQTFSVQIRTVSTSGAVVASSNIITVNDTSTTPAATYSASATTPVNEGSSSTVTVTTTNVTNGTTLYWTVLNGTTANADFSATSGSFTVNSNSGSFTVPIVADATTEGSQTFSVQIRTVSTSGSVVATSNTVTINDTSTTPAATYSASATTPVNEGSSSTVTVTTTNVTNGTTLYWTVLNGTTANADFSATSGSFTVNSNSGSFTVPIVADSTTEGSETFSVQIRTVSTSGSVVATSNTVTINDTSTTPGPTITLNDNYSVEDYQDLGTGAVASITFESDGDIILSPGGDVGDWISPKSAAPGSYQIRATLVSGDTPTGTTLNTWHNLTSNRTWSATKPGGISGTRSCTLTIEIRLGTTVLDSATVTLYAEVLDGGGGGNQ